MNPYETIILDWSASTTQSELGSNVTYTIFADLGGNVLSNTTAPNALTYTFTGLETGGLYKFTIIATASGKSSIPEDVPAVFIRTMIHPVYDLSAGGVEGTVGTIAVEWTPGTNYDATYQIVATPTIGLSSEFTVDAPLTSFNCSDLLPNRLYQLVVTTFIFGQSSEPETYIFGTTKPVFPPTNLTITSFDISTATLMWDAPTSENIQYLIEATTYTGISQTFSGITDTQFVCDNLTSGALYYFSVYTVYKGVQSIASVDLSESLPVGPPSNISFIQINPTSVELNWSASPAQVAGYQNVTYNISGNNVADPDDNFYFITSPNELTYPLNGIINPGSLYDVYIIAEFQGTESEPALKEVFTGTAPPPDLVAVPTDGSTDSITVSWTPSITAGVSYRVYVDGVPQDAGTSTTYTLTGLDAGTSYDIYVTAFIGTNQSDPTITRTVTTYIDPPFNLLNTPTVGNPEYGLAFSWNGVVGSEYEVTLLTSTEDQLTSNTTTTTYEFSDLLSGEKYNASIRSIIGDLCSYSVNFDNPYYTVVAPVTNLTATPAGGAAGSTSLILDWSLSTADYGDPSNARYDIYVDSTGPTSINGGISTFPITGLQPARSYIINVQTRRLNPRRTSTNAGVIASTDAKTFPTMTFVTAEYGFTFATDTIGGGIALTSTSMFVTDISGGDIWLGDRVSGNPLNALGVPTPFTNPRGISYNPNAPETPLLVADSNGVTAISLDGQQQTLIDGASGNGWGVFTDTPTNNTYVSFPNTSTVELIDGGLNVSTYAENLGSSPEGITFVDGLLYAADSALPGVTYVTPAGSEILVSGFPFTSPTAILYSVDGNLYVADRGNRKIFKVTLAGVVTTFVTLNTGFSPLGMVQDPTTGNLYVTHPNGSVTEIQVTLT